VFRHVRSSFTHQGKSKQNNRSPIDWKKQGSFQRPWKQGSVSFILLTSRLCILQRENIATRKGRGERGLKNVGNV
jgi:hypothetical protein